MNTTTQTMEHHSGRVSAFRWIASESVMAAIVSIAIIALAIVGLAGVYSLTMAAIATIITGAALLLEGGAFEAFTARSGNAASGLSADMIGALAGIVLGILALLGVASMTLLSVAVLIFGVTFLLSGSAMSERGWSSARDAQLLLGLSATVLGLLAVIGISSVSLVLVGLLVLGAAGLFGGTAKSFRALHEAR